VDDLLEQSPTHATNVPTSFPPEGSQLPFRSPMEPEATPHVLETRERQTVSRPKTRHPHMQQPRHAVDDQLEMAEPDAALPHAFKSAVRTEERQHKQPDSIFHATLGCGGSNRVENSGPQPLTVSAMARDRGPAVQSGLEETLESLRVAHITERSRVDHDLATQAKTFEKVKGLLSDQPVFDYCRRMGGQT
jgi:hypothetical protein